MAAKNYQILLQVYLITPSSLKCFRHRFDRLYIVIYQNHHTIQWDLNYLTYYMNIQVYSHRFRFICCFTLRSNSQGHIATGSLQVEETSAYCTVNHQASARNYQLSNMKRPARDSNRQPQRLEARTLTATPPSPLFTATGPMLMNTMTKIPFEKLLDPANDLNHHKNQR